MLNFSEVLAVIIAIFPDKYIKYIYIFSKMKNSSNHSCYINSPFMFLIIIFLNRKK